MVPAEGRQEREGEYLSIGSISLEVVEMTANDLLDVDPGGMVGKDKGNPVAVAGRKRGDEGRSAGGGSDLAEDSFNNGARESSVEEEGGHFGCSLGVIRTDATDSEELGEWNRDLTESRVEVFKATEVDVCLVSPASRRARC
eukprot:g30597.t1